jgi:hypothetical protein
MVTQSLLINALRQVLVQRLRDDVGMAEDFASEYHDPDNAIGANQLETYESYYSLLTNAPSRVYWTEGTDQVGFDSYTRGWEFGLNAGDHTTAHIHEAGHALFSPFDYAGRVAQMMHDARIHRMVNIMEDRRIEFLCDLWWKGADVYEYHRADLIRQSAKAWAAYGNAPIYTSTMPKDDRWEFGESISDDMHGITRERDPSWEARAVSIAVSLITYDLPGVVYDPVIMKVVEKFKEKILAAGCSIDKNAAIRVAVEIANYMDWLNEPDEPEPGDGEGEGEPCDDGEPGDGQGQGEGQGEGEGGGEGEAQDESDDPGQNKGEGEGQGQGDSPDQDDGKGQGRGRTAPTDTPTGGDSTAPTPRDEPEDGAGGGSGQPTALDELLEKALDKTGRDQARDIEAKVLDEIRESQGRRPKVSMSHHTIELLNLRTEQIKPDARMKAMLDSMSDIDYHPRAVVSGAVTPKVWQIRHGNIKVFRQPPKRRGRTLVFVDCSYSMGCPCDMCHNKQWKAWMVANAVAKAAGNAELYGFGGGSPTGIGVVPVGHKPACRNGLDSEGTRPNDLGSGTPICSALLYAEALMQGGAANTTLVFVTDGEAGSADGCNKANPEVRISGRDCTHHHATRLAEAGVDFVAICMGTDAAFPASVVANLSPNSNTRDISNLTEAIKHIRSKR